MVTQTDYTYDYITDYLAYLWCVTNNLLQPIKSTHKKITSGSNKWWVVFSIFNSGCQPFPNKHHFTCANISTTSLPRQLCFQLNANVNMLMFGKHSIVHSKQISPGNCWGCISKTGCQKMKNVSVEYNNPCKAFGEMVTVELLHTNFC